MPMHRANKSKSRGRSGGGEPWYAKQKKRQRVRNKIAKASRRKNRK